LVQDDLAGGVSRSRLIAGTAANIRVPEERLELSRDFSRWILRTIGCYTGR
jgi:hypothetical protein